MNNKVSVIITGQYGAHKICRAVKSVLNQTYESIELIVVDTYGKGSFEQRLTEVKLKEFTECHIKYIPDVSRNAFAARNIGFKASTGEYICFLDGDDYYEKNGIKHLIDILSSDKENFDMVYPSFIVNDNNEKKRIIHIQHRSISPVKIFMQSYQLPCSGMIITRRGFETIGGFDESFSTQQDFELMSRISSQLNFTSTREVCLTRETIKANPITSGELNEDDLLQYLDKSKKTIDLLKKSEQKKVYWIFYSEIAKHYYLKGDHEKYREYRELSKNSMGTGIKTAKSVLKNTAKSFSKERKSGYLSTYKYTNQVK